MDGWQSKYNLKHIAVAMHIHHKVHEKFPARANCDTNGKLLLSWRVLILPYLDQNDLYLRFRTDEPWDSEYNQKLIPLMPTVYRNPSGTPQPGMTQYLAVCGRGLLFDLTKGKSIAEITDGASCTIMVVEADPDRAVIWTKPDDLEYNAAKPFDGLGKAQPGGFYASFADAAVRFIGADIDPKVFQTFLTISDCQAIPEDMRRRLIQEGVAP